MTQHAPISLEAVAGLFAVATGQIAHVNYGSCPDIVEGALVRDDDCPACQLLLAADAQLREAGVTLPAFIDPDKASN